MTGGVRLVCVTTLVLGCAPIDVSNTVTIRPREGPTRQFGDEQLVARDFVADYVQLGPRLLVEVRELRSCAVARHVPVLRVEEVERSNRNFVIWDFAVGAFTGAFATLAFTQPQVFSAKLVGSDGRVIYDKSSAYLVGGVFAGISTALLTAGIVDALRSRDETRYADAYEVELGPEQPCAGTDAAALSERGLRLIVADGAIELEARTDLAGRARFSLPPWDHSISDGPTVPAVLEIATADGADVESESLSFELRVPFLEMVDAHTGVVDTRTPTAAVERTGPVEGPQPEPGSP